MAQPTPFSPSTDYSQYAADHPNAPFSAEGLDVDLSAVALTTTEIITNLGLIQRDDGALANESVGVDTIDAALKTLMLGSGNIMVKGPWVTGQSYVSSSNQVDVVSQSNATYICAVSHVAGTFATDLAAGKWVILFNNATAAASGVTFTPTGSIAATNVQSAIAEVDNEKLAKSANLSDLTALQTARDNLQVPSKSTLQLQTYTYFADTGAADAMVLTPSPAIQTSYTNGLKLAIKVKNTNATNAPTLNVSALGAKNCYSPNGDIILPGQLVANSIYEFEYNTSLNGGAGGWGVFGLPAVAPGASGTVLTSNGTTAAPTYQTPFLAASNAQAVTGTDTSTGLTPASARYHAGVTKASILFKVIAGTPTAFYVYKTSTTIVDNGTGDFTVTWTNTFSSANYTYKLSTEANGAAPTHIFVKNGGQSASSLRVFCLDSGGAVDPTGVSIEVSGDLA